MKIRSPSDPASEPGPPECPPLPKCIQQGCGLPAVHRGLCLPCYRSAARLVRLKQTTWAELEADGQALPSRGRRKTSLLRNLQTKGVV